MTERLVCADCGARQMEKGSQCPTCGSQRLSPEDGWSRESLSPAAKVYTSVFVAWALLFPFLLPIILRLSAGD